MARRYKLYPFVAFFLLLGVIYCLHSFSQICYYQNTKNVPSLDRRAQAIKNGEIHKSHNKKSQVTYSSWKCSGNINYESEWRYRTCAFKNICFNKNTSRFEFYRSRDRKKRPILFEPQLGHIYDFNINNHGFVGLVARASEHESWGPSIVDDKPPPKDQTVFLENVHVLFMHWYVPFNPGHVIWEDIASPYFAMVRLNELDRNAVLLEYRNFPKKGDEFYRMYQNLVPAVASQVDSLDHYVKNFSSPFVCFDTLVAGGAHQMFSLLNEPYTHGKERLMYDYRTAILQYHGVEVSLSPTRHRIVLVNKTRALRQSLRGIKNLHEIEQFLRSEYPKVQIDVIDWNKYTFTQQMHELYQTTILITPCGGISSIVPFLPDGTHAIIMDYFVNKKAYTDTEKYKIGESASMDAALFNFFPHVNKLYYQVRNPDDYLFDFPGASNARYDAVVILNATRLKELIDIAFYENDI